MGEEFPGQEFGAGPRAPAAFGGIMDTYTGRRRYGLGSFLKKTFKKAKRAVQKIAKSPLGKAALIAGTMYLTRNMGPIKGAGGWKKYLLGAPAKAGAWTGAGVMSGPGLGATYSGAPATGGILSRLGLTKGAGSLMPTWLGVGTAATAAPFAMQALGKWEDQPELPGQNIAGDKFDFDYGQMRKDIADAVQGGDYNEFTSVLDQYGLTEGNQVPNWGTLAHGAEGGRVGRQEGGNLFGSVGGMGRPKYLSQGGRIGYRSGTFAPNRPYTGTGDLTADITGLFRDRLAGRKTVAPNRPYTGSGDLTADITGLFRDRLAGRKNVSPQRGNVLRGDLYGRMLTTNPDATRALSSLNDSSLKAQWEIYVSQGGTLNYTEWKTGQMMVAEGGRIGRQEGGLMDLGGMEKDYREDGGFVPLGGEEKADDVPARLSRNEFVFTADAVKNAGGGDIDRGAQVMENVMKNLEAGGKVSEESQGKGAQDMFEVSERLSEVV